ncbi:hypothetical protein JCM8547_005377 [Rhodosporidiobolus lusitaniae]
MVKVKATPHQLANSALAQAIEHFDALKAPRNALRQGLIEGEAELAQLKEVRQKLLTASQQTTGGESAPSLSETLEKITLLVARLKDDKLALIEDNNVTDRLHFMKKPSKQSKKFEKDREKEHEINLKSQKDAKRMGRSDYEIGFDVE